MKEQMASILGAYEEGTIDRRGFIAKLVGITGSMAAAHLLLESTGLAATLVSDRESGNMKVVSRPIFYPADDGQTLTGYLSEPDAKGPFPGVIVIHENRGLNDHIRDVARRFAAAGFVALAPDLLARKGGTASMSSPDAARDAIMALPAETASGDLKAALTALARHAKVDPDKLGSVGFCWGGARSFLLATESDRLRAAVVFYGSAPEEEKLARIKAPVLGLYGETDERITSKVPEVAAEMTRLGKQYEYKIYRAAGHAFFNDTGERYDAAAAKDAWERTLAFLHAKLG